MASKKGSSKSEALRNMRESAPETGEAVDAPETKAAKRIRESAEKKAAKVQAEAEKKAAKIQAAADKKAAEKQAAADKKAAEKLAREVARTEAKAERERKKAEREANRKPKTGALTLDQFTALTVANKGEVLPPLQEPTDEQKDKLALEADKKMRDLDGKIKQATVILLGVMQWKLWERIVNPETGEKDFKSAESWAASAMPVCRAQNYGIIRSIAKLGPYIPAEDLTDMPMRNRQLLIANPSVNLKDREIVEAAKGSHKGLKKALKKKHPELHLEESSAILVSDSVKTKHNEAIEAIIALHELDSNEEAEEALAEYFMQGQTENPNYAGKSNREAYQAYLDAESRPEDEPQADSVSENQPEQVEQ